MNFAQHSPRALKMFLHRYGENVTVYDDPETGSDVLNHKQGTFQPIGETLCMRHFQGGNDNQEQDYDSGFYHLQQITFVFPHDSVIGEDTHIIYDDKEYEITGVTNRRSHIEAIGKWNKENTILDTL